MELIDKKELANELARLQDETMDSFSNFVSLHGQAAYSALAKVENFVDNMQVKAWRPADGDILPEIEREVIVLKQPYPLEGAEYAVAFAHRPNPKGWYGKSMLTGKTEDYIPKTYGEGGWNIPDVVWWLDVELPITNKE